MFGISSDRGSGGDFSEVTNVEIKKQPDGTSRGFAFVTFAEKVLRPAKNRVGWFGDGEGLLDVFQKKEQFGGKYD